MVDGLAFLPLHEVQTRMEYLRSVAMPGSEALLDYFDSTYVSGSFRSIQRPAVPGEGQLGMRLRKMTGECICILISNKSSLIYKYQLLFCAINV